MTARRCVIFRSVTNSSCTALTLSRMVVTGNRGPWNGSGVLLGDDELPLPKSSVATRNSLVVSSASPGPISHSYPW